MAASLVKPLSRLGYSNRLSIRRRRLYRGATTFTQRLRRFESCRPLQQTFMRASYSGNTIVPSNRVVALNAEGWIKSTAQTGLRRLDTRRGPPFLVGVLMTDMPSWRAWAEGAHRVTLSPGKSRPRLRCSRCKHRSTMRQARRSKGHCIYCGALLRCKGPYHDLTG